ncbi:hypothetical protein JHK87_009813 [Glycine soja]|nr:hypothetical protein JHK87_009813 [Glycine soja]
MRHGKMEFTGIKPPNQRITSSLSFQEKYAPQEKGGVTQRKARCCGVVREEAAKAAPHTMKKTMKREIGMELELTQTTVRVSSRPVDVQLLDLFKEQRCCPLLGWSLCMILGRVKWRHHLASFFIFSIPKAAEASLYALNGICFAGKHIKLEPGLPKIATCMMQQSQKGKDEPDFGRSLSDNISLRHKDEESFDDSDESFDDNDEDILEKEKKS